MSNETQIIPKAETSIVQSQESAAFELLQRRAKMLASSTLIPKEFQGNMANCAIGLNIASRLGADPFMVLQNIDIIHGRPSFRASFLIAMVNASGRFSPLLFKLAGEGQKRTCVAYAKDLASGELVEGPMISMEMAKAEGWSTKAGSKWITMPELMLRYRSAAFFARIYAPDITLGMQTAEELNDVGERDVTPRTTVKATPLEFNVTDTLQEATVEDSLTECLEAVYGSMTPADLARAAEWAETKLAGANKSKALTAINDRAEALSLVWDDKKGVFVES